MQMQYIRGGDDSIVSLAFFSFCPLEWNGISLLIAWPRIGGHAGSDPKRPCEEVR